MEVPGSVQNDKAKKPPRKARKAAASQPARKEPDNSAPAKREPDQNRPPEKAPPRGKQPPVKTRNGARPNEHTEPPISPVSTSGKTAGPHNPALSKEDREYFRTHLLSKEPIARFDTHGPIAHVLSDIQQHAPMIFGKEGEKAAKTLQRVIRHYTANEQWTYVVVSLSTGFARREVEALLSRKLGHTGPLIIDPDASTEDHQVFASETEARIQKERIIKANEDSGKILLVLYAIDNPDGNKQREASLKQLESKTAILGFMLEEDARFRGIWGLDEIDEQIMRRFKMIGKSLSEAMERLPWVTSNQFPKDDHGAILNDLRARLEGALGLHEVTAVPIYMTIMRAGIIPSRWGELGIVDPDFRSDRDLIREANVYRERLARLREHIPESRLQAEERHELREAHRVGYVANPLAHEAAEAHEQSEEFARDRSHLLYREARNDTLESGHEAEDNRLEGLELGARTPGERAEYGREIAAADAAFRVTEAQEEQLETRERRNTQREAEARIDGTAEGRYAELTGLDERQRQEFALQTNRENLREARNTAEDNRETTEAAVTERINRTEEAVQQRTQETEKTVQERVEQSREEARSQPSEGPGQRSEETRSQQPERPEQRLEADRTERTEAVTHQRAQETAAVVQERTEATQRTVAESAVATERAAQQQAEAPSQPAETPAQPAETAPAQPAQAPGQPEQGARTEGAATPESAPPQAPATESTARGESPETGEQVAEVAAVPPPGGGGHGGGSGSSAEATPPSRYAALEETKKEQIAEQVEQQSQPPEPTVQDQRAENLTQATQDQRRLEAQEAERQRLQSTSTDDQQFQAQNEAKQRTNDALDMARDTIQDAGKKLKDEVASSAAERNKEAMDQEEEEISARAEARKDYNEQVAAAGVALADAVAPPPESTPIDAIVIPELKTDTDFDKQLRREQAKAEKNDEGAKPAINAEELSTPAPKGS